MNHKFIFPALLTFLLLGSARSQETENPQIAELRERYEQALNLAESPLEKLRENYLEALRKLKKSIQQKGHLEHALLVEKEMEDFRKPGERDYSAVPDLNQLRRIYDESHSTLSRQVSNKQLDIMRQAAEKFEELSKDLTQQGSLAAAVQSKKLGVEILEKAEQLSLGDQDRKESAEPVEEDFQDWLERVTFEVIPSRTTFKYRNRRVSVVRASGMNEDNRARITPDQKIEFDAKAGPAYIEVAPDRKSAIYYLNSTRAALLNVVETDDRKN